MCRRDATKFFGAARQEERGCRLVTAQPTFKFQRLSLHAVGIDELFRPRKLEFCRPTFEGALTTQALTKRALLPPQLVEILGSAQQILGESQPVCRINLADKRIRNIWGK